GSKATSRSSCSLSAKAASRSTSPRSRSGSASATTSTWCCAPRTIRGRRKPACPSWDLIVYPRTCLHFTARPNGTRPATSSLVAAASCISLRGADSETRVLSAHRTPEALRDWVDGLEGRGVRVVICGAGGAAHLAGAVAALTTLPVIGVPLVAPNAIAGGLDALLSTVQMPRGVPVATVAVGEAGAANAAILAAEILATADEEIGARLRTLREGMAAKVLAR